MKLNEILKESKKETSLDEAPVGALNLGLKKLGGAVLSKVPGAGNLAAQVSGSVESGQLANTLFTQFNRWLGRTGLKMNDVTQSDVARFLGTQGISSRLSGNLPISKSDIQKEFVKAAQMRFGARNKGPGYAPAGATSVTTMPPTPQAPSASSANQISQQRQAKQAIAAKNAQAAMAAPVAPTAKPPVAPAMPASLTYKQVKQYAMTLKPREKANLAKALQPVAPVSVPSAAPAPTEKIPAGKIRIKPKTSL